MEFLEIVFLARRLPAWRPGIGTREVRAPKGYIVDSGLLAHLLGADEQRIGEDDQITGKVLENFVAMELLRLSEWADTVTGLTPDAPLRGRPVVSNGGSWTRCAV